ncbi:MAG: glycolate oxidase subunit GlcF [Gammaproteobacteria bacterium]|nr:glycolate oxidase subunit GlcF [Gammaproteobacteria bacterium]
MRVELAQTLADTEQGQRAEEILRKCVHCGFCNATCPTYNLLGDELDGPRGRIYLIKGMFESDEVDEHARFHLDRCLTCRNCETTCPSGVEYGELLELGRNYIHESSPAPTFLERLLLWVVPHHRRLAFMVRLGRLFRWFVPTPLKRMIQPVRSARTEDEDKDALVTLLQGCAQRAMTPEVNQHIAGLLRARNIPVRLRATEQCCGGLHMHLGRHDQALHRMSANVEALYDDATRTYLSSASGCGVTVKDYGRLLGTPEAKVLAQHTQDIAEYLQQFTFERHPNIQRVALHVPCTLQHGQKIPGLIEKILERTGYVLVSVRDAHLCCGSAGSYSLLQPELSEQLLDRKLAALEEQTPDVIATANVGCHLHLRSGTNTRVVHWVTLLH